MNNPELFQQAFGPENHEIINAFYEIWFPIRKELFTVIKQGLEDPKTLSRESVRREVKKLSNTLSPYNRRFLEMCLQRYTLYLKESLNRPG